MTAGEDRQSVLASIQSWVGQFDLASAIHLSSPVDQARPTANGWSFRTPAASLQAGHLIATTGLYNRPRLPAIERHQSTVIEWHSSTLANPAVLQGRDVTVIGGGASAYDLLDQCVLHGARSIHWVYRSTPKWMMPTTKSKASAANIRAVARQVLEGVPMATISASVDASLRERYQRFGLQAILPDAPFEFGRHQLIPGRGRMIERFESIERHPGRPQRLAGNEIVLDDNQRWPTDIALWATGYEVDLRYFDVPALASIVDARQLARRCGGLYRALDAPRLYFLAPNLLETTSVCPWGYAHSCRTIVSSILGRCELSKTPVAHHLSFMDLVAHLAEIDPHSFAAAPWPDAYRGPFDAANDELPLPMPMPAW